MNTLVSSLLFLTILHYSYCGPLRLRQKRAAFYIANETACVVDNTVYSNGDPIPTDDPCEACKCRPPGFACVLKECEKKPGCRAVRRAGHCCPDYICGCEHNGRMYRDGDEIRDPKNPCYTCHCQGSSIACAFIDCFFRVDCAPEQVPGECCPHYTNCTEPKNAFEGNGPYLKDEEVNIVTTLIPSSVIVPGVSYVEDTTEPQNIDTTVIEIFEVETKEPELLQLNPDVVSVIDRLVGEESEENIPKEEISLVLSGTPDSETSPEEEIISNKNIDSEVDDAIAAIPLNTEQTVPHHEISTPKTDSDVIEPEKTEHSTEATPQPEAPLVVENVNVESEEPNNNLESKSPSADYGKSLKFDDTKEQESEIVPKEKDETESKVKDETESKEKVETESKEKDETESKEQNGETEQRGPTKQESGTELEGQESKNQQPQKLLYIKEDASATITTVNIREETVSPASVKVLSTIDEKLVNTDLTSNSDSTEKISLYAGKDSLQTESVETVTTFVEVKDTTMDKSGISVTPTVAVPKFNSDKLEDQNSTIVPDVTSIKNDETVSTIKTEDVKPDLSSTSKLESAPAKAETVLPTTFSKVDDKITTIRIDIF